MAFTLQNWARCSVSALEPLVTLGSGTVVGCFREYFYYSALDSQATVAASGYFNAAAAYAGVSADIVTGDIVRVYSLLEGTYVTYSLTNTAGVVTSAVVTGGSGATNYAQKTIALADVLTLYSVPVSLVAAPGAGKMILLDKITLDLVWGSVAFSGGGVVAPQYDSTVHGGGVNAATTTVAASFFTGVSASQAISLTGLVASTATSSLINKPLYLSMATADFTVGTGCSLIVNTWYKVVTAS